MKSKENLAGTQGNKYDISNKKVDPKCSENIMNEQLNL